MFFPWVTSLYPTSYQRGNIAAPMGRVIGVLTKNRGIFPWSSPFLGWLPQVERRSVVFLATLSAVLSWYWLVAWVDLQGSSGFALTSSFLGLWASVHVLIHLKGKGFYPNRACSSNCDMCLLYTFFFFYFFLLTFLK